MLPARSPLSSRLAALHEKLHSLEEEHELPPRSPPPLMTPLEERISRASAHSPTGIRHAQVSQYQQPPPSDLPPTALLLSGAYDHCVSERLARELQRERGLVNGHGHALQPRGGGFGALGRGGEPSSPQSLGSSHFGAEHERLLRTVDDRLAAVRLELAREKRMREDSEERDATEVGAVLEKLAHAIADERRERGDAVRRLEDQLAWQGRELEALRRLVDERLQG